YKIEIMEDEVIKNMRACLMASKGGLTIDDLCRDYNVLLDEDIPFKKLGYPTLHDFLNIVPGIKIRERRGAYFIEAIPTSKSAHISKLVSQQKTTTKKPKRLVNTRKSLITYKPVDTKKVSHPTRTVCSPMKKVPSMKEVPPSTETVSSNTKKVPCSIKRVIDTSRMIGSEHTATIENPRPIKITFFLNDEYPRYVHPITPIPESKRLKKRQINTAVWPDQTIYESKYGSYYRSNEKIYKKSRTVNNNVDSYNKSYYKEYRNRSPESLYNKREMSFRDRSHRTYLSHRYYYY
ncbi:uncharacterized protein LOC144470936, partial [Augochlora pura]